MTAHVRTGRETLETRFDAFCGLINSPKLFAVIFEIMRPPAEAGRDFQNCAGWQEIASARKDCAGPLGGGTARGGRPFFARLSPIVLHTMASPIASTHSSHLHWHLLNAYA